MQLSTSRQSSASSTGRPDSGRRNSLRSQGLRDRKHSDPGVNLEDPDVSVNKGESLKTNFGSMLNPCTKPNYHENTDSWFTINDYKM